MSPRVTLKSRSPWRIETAGVSSSLVDEADADDLAGELHVEAGEPRRRFIGKQHGGDERDEGAGAGALVNDGMAGPKENAGNGDAGEGLHDRRCRSAHGGDAVGALLGLGDRLIHAVAHGAFEVEGPDDADAERGLLEESAETADEAELAVRRLARPFDEPRDGEDGDRRDDEDDERHQRALPDHDADEDDEGEEIAHHDIGDALQRFAGGERVVRDAGDEFGGMGAGKGADVEREDLVVTGAAAAGRRRRCRSAPG